MKRIMVGLLLFGAVFVMGCDGEHNFMDVDNPNAKDDFMNVIGSGNIPQMNSDGSGTRNTVKGYANQYLGDSMSGYVDKAKEGLSGARETFKGYYNDGVDELNQMVSDKVNQAISGELNKFKIK